MSRYRKFVVALIGAAATAASLGLLHGALESWVVVVVSFATALGVYQVPNDTAVRIRVNTQQLADTIVRYSKRNDRGQITVLEVLVLLILILLILWAFGVIR